MRDLRTVVESRLWDIGRRIGAVEVHLYRVRLDDKGAGFAGLQYSSGQKVTDDDLPLLKRFQFQLFSRGLQECLKKDLTAIVSNDPGSGGRIIAGLMKKRPCHAYILCPLKTDGTLRGILGIASTHGHDIDEENEFFELLRLNGAILLNHVLRVRRERHRGRKLRAWRRIADQACDFAIRVDDRGVISGTTPFGMGPQTPELDGLRLSDVVAKGFCTELQQQMMTAIESMKVRTFAFQLILGCEGPRWYLARIEPSRSPRQRLATLYLTDHDSEKVLEEKIRELTEQLSKASRLSLLGQMSTEFAHQLNQPLQAILNYCNTTQKRIRKGTATDETTMRALTNIEKSVLHSADVICRVRDFVRFRALRTEAVPLQEIINLVMMLVLPTMRARNADLIVPEDIGHIIVQVDRTQTTHVFVNLIVNAVEACLRGKVSRPRIELSVALAGAENKVVARVRDNGTGLPRKDPDIVFRKFYSGRRDGLGMGLPISREVCESQGGNLWAENNGDEPGCTFLLTLPVATFSDSDTTELAVISGTTPED
ncbi:MAG: ATP-binding protein [Fuerstiella sp.]